ncbi:MAG: ABC transporter substrate-binding protein [Methylobacteriaceae bacterium]|nr:ABC transporter substrate-binding protein [Methylobacteriaceae bacterium]
MLQVRLPSRRAVSCLVRAGAASLALALSFGPLATGPVRAAGPRVVSINLCADQLVLALADPDQILGLSPYARDPLRSFAAADAARFPRLSGTAEEVMVLRPDLTLSGRFTKRATRDLLREQGLRLVELDTVRSLDGAIRQMREVAALLGHPDRADAAVSRIEEAVARARSAADGRPRSVLPLQRRGWVSGGDTLMTSLLAATGLGNAGSALSRGLGRQVSLEAIVALRPDLLLLSEASVRPEDQGSALLQHDALRALYPPEKRIVLPELLTICGGPMLADAVDRLADAVRAP